VGEREACRQPLILFSLDMLSVLLYHLYKSYIGDNVMPTKISTADARKNLSNIVNSVSFGNEPIILTRRGKDIAALVGMDELRLLQELEDHIDIADAIKALKESGEDIPAAQFWKKLGL
jgi:antitoxin Phd